MLSRLQFVIVAILMISGCADGSDGEASAEEDSGTPGK